MAMAILLQAAADSGSLVRYLETFEHTIAVMQTKHGLARVAREFVLDLHADGVIHGELRWAPEQHLRAGLTLDETVEAVQAGIDEAIELVADLGREFDDGLRAKTTVEVVVQRNLRQFGAGITLHVQQGQRVRKGQPLMTLLTDEPVRFERAP